MSMISPTAGSNDPRIAPDRDLAPGGAGRDRVTTRTTAGDTATISRQAAALSDITRSVGEENAAAAAGSVRDVDDAAQLVKQLTAQLASSGYNAVSAQANIDPRAALNLLS
jgi:hypothetical protein